MPGPIHDVNFTCTLTISIPLPTHRLARIALRALQVDAELSPLVKRSFSLTSSHEDVNGVTAVIGDFKEAHPHGRTSEEEEEEEEEEPPPKANGQSDPSQDPTHLMTVLKTEYKATTNRMLRVAVNGFMESLGVVIGVMEELDLDVLDEVAAVGEEEEEGG